MKYFNGYVLSIALVAALTAPVAAQQQTKASADDPKTPVAGTAATTPATDTAATKPLRFAPPPIEIQHYRPLLTFLDYMVPLAPVNLPEGAEIIVPEVACVLTFLLPQFGTTFTYTALAGERVPVLWAAMTCNVVNKSIVHLKPL